MALSTKFNIIDDAIVRINDLADAKGVDKCMHVINLIQNLNELGRMLKEEDATHEAAVLALTEKIDKLEGKTKKEASDNADADTE